jgi:hypothetical protein
MKKNIVSFPLLLISICTFGTAQIPDRLVYKGDTLSLFSCPLGSFPDQELLSFKNMFAGKSCFNTSCWRGYVATWKIEDNKLYLTEIRNSCYPTSEDYVRVAYNTAGANIGKEFADLSTLFPGRFENGRVFADWVNDKLSSPKGKMLYYIHDGFESIFEKEDEFTIKNGLLLSIHEFDNSGTKQSEYTLNQNQI